MRLFNFLRICIFMLPTLILFMGCIHTYPKGEAQDPSLIHITLSLTDATDFLSPTNEEGGNGEEGKRRKMPNGLYRFKTLVIRNGSTILTEETLLSYNSQSQASLELPIRTPLPERRCDILVWGELVNSESLTPLHYDASNLCAITPLPYWESIYATPSRLAFPICLRGEIAIQPETLPSQSSSTNSSLREFILPVACHSPMGLLRIETTDILSFVEAFPNVQYSPDAFSIELSFTTPSPFTFNLLTNSPAEYSISKSVNLPLLLPDATAVKIAEIPLFPSAAGDELTADLTVFNSARAIISRCRDIPITMRPNHTTMVKGAFLSNYFESPLKVENEWEGEIVIDYTK